MPERREKMPPVVSNNHARVSGAGHLGNVRIIDSTACRSVLHRCLKESPAIGGRQIMHRQSGEHFFLEEPRAIRRGEAELRGQPRRDGVELQAAMPCGRGRLHDLFRNRVHD